MTLLLIALLPPLLWSLVNHIDKFLLSKAKHHSSVDVLMVYSTAFSIIVIPVMYFLARQHIQFSLFDASIQIVGGLLLAGSIYFYLVALSKDETSIVLPFALLVPVFGYVFSYFLLGERLLPFQLAACAVILFGTLILSLEIEEDRKLKIKHGVVWAMIACTVLQAAQETLFKFVALENSFVVSVFWLHVGILLFGVSLVVVKPKLLRHFLESVQVNGKTIFTVNIISEGVSTAAYIIRSYALLLAPIALVMTLNSYQPVFVFVLGVILTLTAPKFVTEKIKFIHLLHKSVAISVVVIGTIMITNTF